MDDEEERKIQGDMRPSGFEKSGTDRKNIARSKGSCSKQQICKYWKIFIDLEDVFPKVCLNGA